MTGPGTKVGKAAETKPGAARAAGSGAEPGTGARAGAGSAAEAGTEIVTGDLAGPGGRVQPGPAPEPGDTAGGTPGDTADGTPGDTADGTTDDTLGGTSGGGSDPAAESAPGRGSGSASGGGPASGQASGQDGAPDDEKGGGSDPAAESAPGSASGGGSGSALDAASGGGPASGQASGQDGTPDDEAGGASERGSGGGGPRLVLITGPSGGGRSTAINVLEDLGFEVIDNMPLSLLPRLLDGPALSRSLALGIDVRNRDFSVEATLALMDNLSRSTPGLVVNVLYLDARADVLVRRFSETRRRHPLAPAESVQTGIARELDLLAPIRARADFLIDTSELTPHDLRRELDQWFSEGGEAELAVSVQSFSYKRGVPQGIDMIFDCRFLRNPYWDEALRDLTGQDARVHEFVAGDPRFSPFFAQVLSLSEMLLPAYMEEGKSHFSIGFGCTGGQHRSVTTAEKMSQALAMGGWQVSIRHRELERRGLLLAPGKLR